MKVTFVSRDLTRVVSQQSIQAHQFWSDILRERPSMKWGDYLVFDWGITDDVFAIWRVTVDPFNDKRLGVTSVYKDVERLRVLTAKEAA